MRREKRGFRLLLVVAVLTIAADQGTKYLAVSRLSNALDGKHGLEKVAAFYLGPSPYMTGPLRGRLIDGYAVLPDYWHFRYVENPGAAWGMWGNLPERFRRPFFLGVSVLALGFITFMFTRLTQARRFLRTALALVMGGALGNFADRLARGYVIDFIDLHWRDAPGMRWPTFNVADVAISLGVGLILFESMRARVIEDPEPGAPPVGLAPGAGGRSA